MKKLQFTLLAVCLVMITFAFHSCNSDDGGSSAPSAAFQTALLKLYPNAVNIDWKQKGTYYVADCRVDSRERQVWFDVNANWVMTETDLEVINNLPPAVLTAFMESNYARWLVDDVDMLEFPNEPTPEFVVEVKSGNQEVDLYFSDGGGLLHEKEVTNGDDTHWPRI